MVEPAREVGEGTVGRGHPQVRRTGVEEDGEGLRGRAEGDDAEVLGVHEVVEGEGGTAGEVGEVVDEGVVVVGGKGGAGRGRVERDALEGVGEGGTRGGWGEAEGGGLGGGGT